MAKVRGEKRKLTFTKHLQCARQFSSFSNFTTLLCIELFSCFLPCGKLKKV